MRNIQIEGIPASEMVWHQYFVDDVLEFVLTSGNRKNGYTLYGRKQGTMERLGRAKTPTELENKFIYLEKKRRK